MDISQSRYPWALQQEVLRLKKKHRRRRLIAGPFAFLLRERDPYAEAARKYGLDWSHGYRFMTEAEQARALELMYRRRIESDHLRPVRVAAKRLEAGLEARDAGQTPRTLPPEDLQYVRESLGLPEGTQL